MLKLTIPNVLTLVRISLIPILVVVFYSPIQHSNIFTAIIFAVAAITDWLDGYLARKLHQFSDFGKFLDPVADKLIVAVALVLLVETHADLFLSIPAAIIIGREIVISALREWMAEIGKSAHVAVSYIGKIKTTLQMLAIISLLSVDSGANNLVELLGYILLYLSVVLTIWSMFLYLKAAKDNIADK